MDHATSAVAGSAATSWLWLPALNPWLQFVLAVLGIVWLLMQMAHFRNKDK